MRISKKVLSIFLTALMVVGIMPVVNLTASAAVMAYKTYRPNNNIDHGYSIGYYGGGSTGFINYVENGVTYPGYNAILLHKLDEKMAYCVQPGRPLDPKDPYSKGDSDSMTIYNYDKKTESAIKTIIAYGYSSSTLPAGYGSHTDALDNAFATQLLIWEIVTGERNPDTFERNVVKEYALQWISLSGGGYDSEFKTAYNNLVAKVKNHLGDIETRLKESEEIVTEVNLTDTKDLGEKELELNADGYYVCEFNDDFISDLSLENLNLNGLPKKYLTKNGGKLTVSIPIEDAIAYQNKTYDGKWEKNVTTTDIKELSSETVTYKEVKNFRIYKGKQDMVVTAGAEDVTKPIKRTEKIITSTDWTINLKIKVPFVHTHSFYPHFIQPTCTTYGLTCWECSCGIAYTSDGTFAGQSFKGVTEPLEHGTLENGDAKLITVVAPTCSTDGVANIVCQKCGLVIGSQPVPATGHTENGVWMVETPATLTSKGTKAMHCKKCGVITKTEELSLTTHKHIPGNIVIIRDATCVATGLKGTLCSICGICFETEALPASHAENLVWITSTEATCTTKGEKTGYCPDCGVVQSREDIAELGHAVADTTMTTILPTCTEQGEAVNYCVRCGNITNVVALEPTKHDTGVWKLTAEATAEHDGIKTLFCSKCNQVLEQSTFSMHEHTPGYQKTLLAATCVSDGEIGTACAECGAVYQVETAAATGHSFSKIWTNSNGTHSKNCSKCRVVVTENCEYDTVTVSATCVSDGYTDYKCNGCGYAFTGDTTKATGHNLSAWQPDSNGKTHSRFCSSCSVTETEKHEFKEYLYNGDGDGIDLGTVTATCICGETHTKYADESDCAENYREAKTFTGKVFELFRKVFSLLLIFLIGTY